MFHQGCSMCMALVIIHVFQIGRNSGSIAQIQETTISLLEPCDSEEFTWNQGVSKTNHIVDLNDSMKKSSATMESDNQRLSIAADLDSNGFGSDGRLKRNKKPFVPSQPLSSFMEGLPYIPMVHLPEKHYEANVENSTNRSNNVVTTLEIRPVYRPEVSENSAESTENKTPEEESGYIYSSVPDQKYKDPYDGPDSYNAPIYHTPDSYYKNTMMQHTLAVANASNDPVNSQIDSYLPQFNDQKISSNEKSPDQIEWNVPGEDQLPEYLDDDPNNKGNQVSGISPAQGSSMSEYINYNPKSNPNEWNSNINHEEDMLPSYLDFDPNSPDHTKDSGHENEQEEIYSNNDHDIPADTEYPHYNDNSYGNGELSNKDKSPNEEMHHSKHPVYMHGMGHADMNDFPLSYTYKTPHQMHNEPLDQMPYEHTYPRTKVKDGEPNGNSYWSPSKEISETPPENHHLGTYPPSKNTYQVSKYNEQPLKNGDFYRHPVESRPNNNFPKHSFKKPKETMNPYKYIHDGEEVYQTPPPPSEEMYETESKGMKGGQLMNSQNSQFPMKNMFSAPIKNGFGGNGDTMKHLPYDSYEEPPHHTYEIPQGMEGEQLTGSYHSQMPMKGTFPDPIKNGFGGNGGTMDHPPHSIQVYEKPPHHTYQLPHNYIEDEHHHILTEAPPKKEHKVQPLHTFYYLGRKLWMVPLYAGFLFITYVFALLLKAIYRHKHIAPYTFYTHGHPYGRRLSHDINSTTVSVLKAVEQATAVHS